MGQVQVSTTPHESVQQSWHHPRKYVLTLRRSRHSTCLHRWTFTCYKRLLDRKSYYLQRDVHPPPEGWAQFKRQQIMLWGPQIWIFWLSRHLWRGYDHTKESWGHSSPRSPKNSQTIASVYRYDQLLLWHVAKAIWASCPINCLKFEKRQIRLERRAPKVFWCYQTCDRTWSIVGITGLQCSIWNTYWCFQTTNWRSHISNGQAHCFLFTKYEQCPTKLHHNREITPFHSGISQGFP